jgi:hypothetical protein
MRISVSLAVVATIFGIAGAARAQQPINPYLSGTETVDAPAPVAQPIDPYSAYPAPPAYGYQAPAQGPTAVPSPPTYQQGYYLYPAGGRAPVYYAPPPSPYGGCSVSACCCCACPTQGYQYGYRYNYGYQPRLFRPARKGEHVRRFSLGAHVGFLTLNQQVGSEQVTLGGAGFQIRVRSRGRFGFEASQSFLHGSYWGGAFERDSFPFAVSLMFYVFPNSDQRHFNLYGLAGMGLMPDSVHLYDENRQKVTQDFTEFLLHAGLGAELRLKWFAIEADGRIVGTWRDDSDAPATYYGDVKGAPVQKSSYAFQGNLYLSLWF